MATGLETPEPVCKNCSKSSADMIRCSKCRCGEFCSMECLSKHENHGKYCAVICSLEKLQAAKQRKSDINVQDFEKLPLKMKLKLIRMVGERPLVDVLLNGDAVEGLWDTGSMISLMNRQFLEEQFPGVEIHSVAKFLDSEESLTLTTANQTEMSVDGVALLNFGVENSPDLFQVPFVVTSEPVSKTIIGYNIIEYLASNCKDQVDVPSALLKMVRPLSSKNVTSMVNLLEASGKIEEISREAKLQKTQVIPSNSMKKIRCKVNNLEFNNCSKKMMLFQPLEELCVEDDLVVYEVPEMINRGKKFMDIYVYNPSASDIVVEKGKVMGSVCDVAAAFTLPQISVPEKKGSTVKCEINEVAAESFQSKLEAAVSHLPEEKRKIALKMLEEEQDVFSKSKDDIGYIPDFRLKINLADEVPVVEAYRGVPKNLYGEVKSHISNLLANGWIRESNSPYSSPMVCVRKKCGGLRLCIDFRKLNLKTIPDKHPIPRIQDLLDGLAGNSWFSTFDMSQAYHQGELDEESRKYTAFSTPWALYEWIRIPYGIMNAPPGFQRFINRCLGNLRDTICSAYLDDVITYSKGFEAHVENARAVLRRMREKGVKLNLQKCHFFKQEVKYLGRLVSEDGYRPDPENGAALDRCKIPPTNIGKLRSLIGFLGYYRTYVKDFSKKLKPVYDLLQDDSDKKGSKQLDSRRKIVWTQEHQKVIEDMVEYLKSPEVIAYPDFDLPFTVHCDASHDGLGAVLYQKQKEKMRVISFASRTLTPAEKNYHLHSGKLEFLALKWSITEKFSDYLIFGQQFEVITDNNPLTYLLTTAKLNATALRWVNGLADYHFSIKYRAGKKHIDADYLSRHPVDEINQLKEETDVKVESEDVNLVFSGASKKESQVKQVNVEMLQMKAKDSELETLIKIENEDVIREQKKDCVIGPVYELVELKTNVGKAERKGLSRDSKILLKQAQKLKVVDGMLVREVKGWNQIVLPKVYHQLVYTELHEKLAHLGSEKVLDLARARFYWPKMQRDVEFYIKKQCRCVMSKKPNIQDRAPLMPIESTFPFEMISLDYLHLDKCKGGFEYALVVCDHFTRFVQIYATKKKNAVSAADHLFNEFILKFGFPKKIHHDQGGEFNNRLFQRLHDLSGIAGSRTTPYHPMGDGQVERMNRTIINMLKTLEEKEKNNWKAHLPQLAFAYNATINKSTGYSPYFLMFGRSARLPIDLIFGLDPNEGSKKDLESAPVSYKRFAESWEKSMQEAFEIVGEHSRKAGNQNKVRYDKKVRGVDITVGDRVLLQNREKGGTGKLRSFWEPIVYVVKEVDPNVPVLSIKPECGGKKEVKRVHRNCVMDCEFLLDPVVAEELRRKAKDQTPDPPTPELRAIPIRKKKDNKNKTVVNPEAAVTQEPDVDTAAATQEPDVETAAATQEPGLMEESSDEEEVLLLFSETEEFDPEPVPEIADEEVPVVDEPLAAEEEEIDNVISPVHADNSPIPESPVGSDNNDDTVAYEMEVEDELDQLDNNNSGEDGESEGESSDEEVVRKSDRVRKTTNVFTYDEVGGKPVLRPRR